MPCPVTPYHLQSARYRFYERLLRRLHGGVDRVLLCDVRDVVFAGNLFESTSADPTQLHFFLEDKNIGASLYNSAWVEYAFGTKMLQRIRALPISCSGTTLGSVEAVLCYLERMNAITERLHQAGREIVCGLDQGIHNVLLYAEEFESRSRKLWTNTDGLVFTMGYSSPVLAGDGIPRLPSGDAWQVYHQFDRLNLGDLQRFAAALDIPIDDLSEQRPQLTEGALVRLWYSLRDHQGNPIAELPEGRTVVVEISSFTMGNPLTEALCRHAVGDRLSVMLAQPPMKLLPPPTARTVARRALPRHLDIAEGEWITVQNEQGLSCRMKVARLSEEQVVLTSDSAELPSGCTLHCKVEAQLRRP